MLITKITVTFPQNAAHMPRLCDQDDLLGDRAGLLHACEAYRHRIWERPDSPNIQRGYLNLLIGAQDWIDENDFLYDALGM
jgi:hypothetical protein